MLKICIKSITEEMRQGFSNVTALMHVFIQQLKLYYYKNTAIDGQEKRNG